MTFDLEGDHLGQLNASLGSRLQGDVNLSGCTWCNFSRGSRGRCAAATRNNLGDLHWLVQDVDDFDLSSLCYIRSHFAKVQDLRLKLDCLTYINRASNRWRHCYRGLTRCWVDCTWRHLVSCIKVLNCIWRRSWSALLGVGGCWSGLSRRHWRWSRRLLSSEERDKRQNGDAGGGGAQLGSVSHVADCLSQGWGVWQCNLLDP